MMNIGCKAPLDLKTFSQKSLIVVTFIAVMYMTSSSCASPSDPSSSTSWFSQFWQPLAMLHVTELAIARAPSTGIFSNLTFAMRYLHKADRCRVLLHKDGLQQSVFDFPPIVSRLQGVTLPVLDLKIRPKRRQTKSSDGTKDAKFTPLIADLLLHFLWNWISFASFNFSLSQF